MAELTLQRLQDRMGRYMGWDSTQWPSEILPATVVNEAGRWLFSACEWNFLTRPAATLELVNGQAYIELPDDFGSMIGEPVATTFAHYCLSMTTMQEVADARRLSYSGSVGSYIGAIVWVDPTGAPTMPQARIEIAPTPQADNATAFTLAYRARWTDVTDANDVVMIPAFMEPLFVRLACVWIGGYEADGEMMLEDRIDRVMGGALWEAALNQDCATQQAIGRIGSTAFDAIRTEFPPPFTIGATVDIVP